MVALAAAGGWVLHSWSIGMGDRRESFGEKHEWGMLQGLEGDHRSSPISNLEFTNVQDRTIICLPALSGGRIWIMLNPQSPPYYKQMPQGQYVLSKAQLDQIARQGNPTSTVEACLASHVRLSQ